MSNFFKYKKNSRLALILCIALIIQLVITGVFSVAASARQKQSFNDLNRSGFSVVYDSANSKLKEFSVNAKNMDVNNDLSLYDFSINKNFTAVFKKISDESVNFIQSENPSVQSAKINFQKLDFKSDILVGKLTEVFTGLVNPNNHVYLFFLSANDTYLAVKAQDFIKSFSTITENLLLLTNDIVAGDYKGNLTGMSINRAMGQASDFKDSAKQTLTEVMLNGFGSALLIADDLLDGFYITTYTDLSGQYALMAASIARFTLLSILTICIYGFAWVFYLYSKTKVRDRGNNLIIHVDNYGKVLKAPKKFKDIFDVDNIFKFVNFNQAVASKIIMSALPITAEIPDKSGLKRTYYLLPNKIKKGYALLFKKVPDMIASVINTTSEDESGIENTTRLYQDIKALSLNLVEGSAFFILFELKNISNYRLMFGTGFYKQIKRKYAQMLLNRLYSKGTLYNYDYEQYCFISTDKVSTRYVKQNIESFIKELNLPVQIGDNAIKIDCIAGGVEVNSQTVADLLNYGSLALIKAQDLNKKFNIYDTSTGIYSLSKSRKLDIANEIIENGDIMVNFQPQFDTSKNVITGFECLTRISGKHSQALKIQEFIELCEQGGLMIVLGDIIFEKAFEFAKNIEYYNAVVSLNVSPLQLMQAGFVKNFLDKYNTYGLKPGSVSIEITETFLMTSFDETIQKLDILNKNGIHIHLDDFGVAYSSMLYLKKLPINAIKIDREFITDIEVNNFSRVICSKISDIAKELNLDIIAEGVETEAQKDILSEINCNIIQGYFISPAINKERAMALLNKYNIN